MEAKKLICIRECKAFKVEIHTFEQIDLGTIVYDARINEVGALLFKVSGKDYISSDSSFFTEFSEANLRKTQKIAELKTQYREILKKINKIQNSF